MAAQRRGWLLLLLSLAVLCGGCSTSYWLNRGRDAADIFTVCVGAGVGAKARVGPVHVGAIFDNHLLGLRGGEVRGIELGSRNGCFGLGTWDREFPFFTGSTEVFALGHTFGSDSPARTRDKDFIADAVPIWEGVLPAFPGAVPFLLLPQEHRATYYCQLEAVIGLVPSLRLGFNPAELLDFIAGWTTLDILSDDMEWGADE